MTGTKQPTKPLTEMEKQFLPMQGEPSPNEVKTKAFLAIQKAKARIGKGKK